jgi:predicted ribosomally synthesized peptide with nif11-like leader
MSLENVKLFYERLSVDQDFNSKIQGTSKEEFNQIIIAEGYDFTEQEFEDYSAQMIESADEQELEAIVGGIGGVRIFPIYGLPIKDWL